ncbi:MAG: agmatinase [Anaerolineales bacterium]|uniref:agmatinase n=1 Tax=Candidatus Villigracilis proximus TaxID=3140683 RepID=UPI00313675C8|nr:agmatinase [Anaerolineales bacterium]
MNDNPAFGAGLQPFMGIPSFMRLPVTRELKNIDAAIMGVPYDSAVSYRSGIRFGPRKIREMSLLLWGHNSTLNVTPLKELNVVDYGDVSVIPTSIEHTMAAITKMAGEIIETGTKLITLGGDHSIALPLLRAHAKKHGPVSLVHIDAHIDTWESEFDAVPYSHGTPFRYALQEGLIRKDEYMQIGIRGPLSGANDYAEAKELGARTVTIHEVMEKGVKEILKEVHERMTGPVYVTVDIDSADPAYAPGTGTPEVGGLSSYQLLQLVRGLHGLDLIGFDLVEVSPPFDHADITAILASNIVFEYLSLLAIKEKK